MLEFEGLLWLFLSAVLSVYLSSASSKSRSGVEQQRSSNVRSQGFLGKKKMKSPMMRSCWEGQRSLFFVETGRAGGTEADSSVRKV